MTLLYWVLVSSLLVCVGVYGCVRGRGDVSRETLVGAYAHWRVG